MKYFRAVYRYSAFLVATFGIYGVWLITSPFIPNKILWRQKIFQAWARSFVRISRMKIEIVGTPPTAPFFLVCNHLSYTDVPALLSVVDSVFVAKSEVREWFAAGRICRDMGTIFINRSNRRDIPRAGGEIIKRFEQGEGVTVFPEGTSTVGETVLPFNSSFFEFAARADLPISYASISYRTPSNHPKATETVSWWDEKSFGEHLWYLFQAKEFTATIQFGDTPIRNADRKELARMLREKVLENFVPVL